MASSFIPPPFYLANPHNMTFLDRLLVIGGNSLLNFGRHLAVLAGFQFSFMPDLSPDLWRGRLAFVNSIPGFDYPQLLPPLVQYTGPVVDVKKMEAFPEEVESWLEAVPEGMPVVYVSYGTMVRLTPERVAATLRTLTSTEHFTLWALPKAQQVGLPETLAFQCHDPPLDPNGTDTGAPEGEGLRVPLRWKLGCGRAWPWASR